MRFPKHLPAAALAVGLTFGVAAPAFATTASSEVPAKTVGSSAEPWIVGVGDSYMSGEGAIWSNKNYGESENKWTYHRTGNISQVYGDNNGIESIPFAHRSYSAPMHIGGKWHSKNLAVSGAQQVNTTAEGNRWKPGIEFNGGQADMLKDFAENHDVEVVALSIGGNDFGFGELARECVDAYTWNHTARDSATGKRLNSDANYRKVTDRVRTAVANIQRAMDAAGRPAGSWKLVYQAPPMFVSDSKATKGSDRGWDRQDKGGAGIRNADLDWLNHTVGPNLRDAMYRGVRDARPDLNPLTKVTFVDDTEAFNSHRIYDKDTKAYGNYPNYTGMHPEFKNDNGKDGEWVTPMNISDQLKSDWHMKQNPWHPNYWGQRALASCLELGVNSKGNDWIYCKRDGAEHLDTKGRPAMQVDNTGLIWKDLPDSFKQPAKLEIDVVNKYPFNSRFNDRVVPAGMKETFTFDYVAGTDNHIDFKDADGPLVSNKMFTFQMDQDSPTATVKLISPSDKQFVFGKTDKVRNSQGTELIATKYEDRAYTLFREFDAGTSTVKLTLTFG